MKTVGIIMECNPFHEGHRYIIRKAGEIAGEGGHIVVVMSGNFAQRGIPAVVSKEERAGQILEAGADLVLELPVRLAVSSAEYYAEGAVALLCRTGMVTDLVFGSECGDLDALTRCAFLLYKEPEDYRLLLRRYMASGQSYPSVCARSAAECSEHVTLPDSPNDVLAVEYLKSLLRMDALRGTEEFSKAGSAGAQEQPCSGKIPPEDSGCRLSCAACPAKTRFPAVAVHAVRRIPSVSASELRRLRQQTDDGIFADDFSGMLLEKLLMADRGQCRCALEEYAGVSPDLSNRIHRLLPQYLSWTQFCSLLKTRNLTWTAVSRALTHILLDITKETVSSSGMIADSHSSDPGALMPESLIPYARVLGCRRAALPLIGEIRKNGLVLITSRADADRYLPAGSMERVLLESDLGASETWELAAGSKGFLRETTAGTGIARVPAVSEYAKPLLIV